MSDTILKLAPSPAQNAAPDLFDDFWSACPKRAGKPLARAKFLAITSPDGLRTQMLDRDSNTYVALELKGTADELIAAMKRYRDTQIVPSTRWERKPLLKDGGKYTLHPATWLNRGRWQDDE